MKARLLGRILLFCGAVLLLALSVPVMAGSRAAHDPQCKPLIAFLEEQKPINEVGEVCIWNTATHLYINMKVDSPHMLMKTMASVAGENEGKPGSWEYEHTGLASAQDLFEISFAEEGLTVGERARIWVGGSLCCLNDERLPVFARPIKYTIRGDTTTSTTEPTTSTTEPATTTTEPTTSTTRCTTTTNPPSGGGRRHRARSDDEGPTAVAAVTATSTTVPPVATTVAAVSAVAPSEAQEELPYTGVHDIWLILGYSLSFVMIGSGLLLVAR